MFLTFQHCSQIVAALPSFLPGTDNARVVNPVAALAADPVIAAALGDARSAINAVLWRRDIRANAEEVATTSMRTGARDSAAVEGADLVDVDDSPMGRVLASSIAVTAEAMRLDEMWPKAPAQVFARLHAVTAHGFSDADQLGRPRATDDPDDPLHIGGVVPAAVIVGRMQQLSDVVVQAELPALLEAAIVHGELMALRPFQWGSGLVARASIRTVVRARGLDPSCFTTPERGIFELGRGAYVTAIREFQRGTIDGMRGYLGWFAAAVTRGC